MARANRNSKSKAGNSYCITALLLPDDHESDIRENIFDQLTSDKLKADDGSDTLVKLLDDYLVKTILQTALKYLKILEEKRVNL